MNADCETTLPELNIAPCQIPHSSLQRTSSYRAVRLVKATLFSKGSRRPSLRVGRPETVDDVERGHVERDLGVIGKDEEWRLETAEGWVTVGELPLLGDHLNRKTSLLLGDRTGALDSGRFGPDGTGGCWIGFGPSPPPEPFPAYNSTFETREEQHHNDVITIHDHSALFCRRAGSATDSVRPCASNSTGGAKANHSTRRSRRATQ